MEQKISFCTVCMNRTMHLKETLHRNILDNSGYKNIEFILLDYGSKDDLYDWAKKDLQPYIAKGQLIYFSTKDPAFFHMSHSKNMALRLATGDILCSIDADNFTGKNFATYINEMFNKDPHIFMAPPRIGQQKKWWDVQGRVCVKRNDFYTLRGYDEQVVDYGYEDQDFKSRLVAIGRRKVTIKDKAFLQAITHEDSLRIAEGFSTKRGKDLFMSPTGDEIIYLQQDNICERFFTNKEAPGERMQLRRMSSGTYKLVNKALQLYKDNGNEFLSLVHHTPDHLVSDNGRHFYRVTSSLLWENFLLKRAIYIGRRIFYRNRMSGKGVNCTGFGQGKVYKNFSGKGINLGLL